MTRAAVLGLGFTLFAPDCPSAAATAVLPPAGVDSGLVVKELKSRFGAIITNGQGEMKGQIFRIAHLGYFDYMDTIALIAAVEQVVLKSIPQARHTSPEGARPVQFGDGLIAAQHVFAEATHPQAETRTCLCGRADACCSLQHPDFGSHTEKDNVDAAGLDPRTEHQKVGA